jgi:flagellar biosynthesis/type III secretory pathway protein FliH
VVETAVGRLDARLDTQLDAMERALQGVARVSS